MTTLGSTAFVPHLYLDKKNSRKNGCPDFISSI